MVLYTTVTDSAQGWAFTVYEASASCHQVSEDHWFYAQPAHALRVGVLDGVTSTDRTYHVGPITGGRLAALHAAECLRQRGCLVEEALAQANRQIRDINPQRPMRSRDRPQAAYAVAEITPQDVTCWVGCDCEVWIRRDREWARLAKHDMLRAGARKDLNDLKQRYRSLPRPQYLDHEAKLLEDRMLWNSTALGRFEQIKLMREHAIGWDELVLATDGAKLDVEALEDLPAHLETVSSDPDRDDICLLHLCNLP